MESKLERIIFIFLGATAGIVVGIFILSYPIPIIDNNIDVFIVILTAIIGSLIFIISIYYKKDKIAKENEKLRSDKPGIGWFAAITIETQEGVIIDLNNYTLQADQKYIEEHLFNVFADIELDNCPFSGKLFGFPNPSHGFANFGGDKEYCAAENVIIKNGILGRSGHWGIHGNNNQNIFIENIIIKDWQVRGIELNGLIKGRIRNVEISGLEHLITSSVPLVGALQILRIFLVKYP